VISRRASGIGEIENYSYRKCYFSHLGVSFAHMRVFYGEAVLGHAVYVFKFLI
jgi:hypothetical protein